MPALPNTPLRKFDARSKNSAPKWGGGKICRETLRHKALLPIGSNEKNCAEFLRAANRSSYDGLAILAFVRSREELV